MNRESSIVNREKYSSFSEKYGQHFKMSNNLVNSFEKKSKPMFLQLSHKSLDVYIVVRELVKEIYLISLKFPPEERYNMISQIRRAGVSVKLNLAEGSSRKSKAERERYYEISRGSLVEIDSIFELAVDLNYVKMEELENISSLILRCFAMFSKMLAAK